MHPQGVSVIMPAYNAELFIKKSIESLQCQTFENWELIVIDDCSIDGTQSIVKRLAKYDSRIQLIKLDKNLGGPAGPRNIGIRNSKNELIAFLDSDDIWHPRKLEIQTGIIRQHKCHFCCSGMTDFQDDVNIVFSDSVNKSLKEITFQSQSIRAKIPASSVVLSKTLAVRFPFNESLSYKAVEDYHCWLRILESGESCLKIEAPLLLYRKSPGQISGSKIMMMKKVFMVHRSFSNRGRLKPLLLTTTHILGAIYFRFLRKSM